MTYDGWRDVTIVWLDGSTEVIRALGRPDPYVQNGVLHLRVSESDGYRHIPLTAMREWRMTQYQ